MKVINWILAALLILGVVAFAFTGFQYMSLTREDYESAVRELDGQAAGLREDAAALEADLERRGEELQKELAAVEADLAAETDRIAALRTENEGLSERLADMDEQTAFFDNIYDNVLSLRDEYAGKIRQLEDMINAGESDVKICYWTFDDGPSYYTQQVLDFAKEEGIYVTFFTSREANSSAANDDPAVERQLLRNMAHAFRGLPKEDLLKTLEELGYVWVDWSCDIYDNGHADPDVATEVGTALYEIRTMKIAMMLSHDWNVNTVWAFKRVVPLLKNEGYVFLPLFSQSWTIGNTTIKFS